MDYRIIPRSEWGARYLPIWGRAPQPAWELWLHHSATIAPDLLPPFTDDYAAVRLLEQIGQERFGGGISYTFVVTPAGLIFEGHPIELLGSHTKNHNSAGRAIVLVGNYQTTRPTDAMLNAVAWLTRHGHERGWWTVDRITGGHRDAETPGYTECPGNAAEASIPEINRRALAGPITPEEPDDMPGYRQWDPADKKALLTDVTSAVIRAVTRGEMPDGATPPHLADASTGHIVGLVELLRVGDNPVPATGQTHPGNLATVNEKLDRLLAAATPVPPTGG